MAKKIKSKTKAESRYMSEVAEVGCIVCRNNGYFDTPAELHHIREGAGMGQRSTHYEVIPLCTIHHRTGGNGEIGYHQNKTQFTDRYGTELKLLKQVEGILHGTR
jgi:hypothetical protein